MSKIECEGCEKEMDSYGSLVVCRRRYENVCSECMDVLELVLEQQLVREYDPEVDGDE